MDRDAAFRAGREPTGMFDLMLWAFNTEKVRYSCGTLVAAKVSHSNMAHLMAIGMSGVRIGADGGSYSPACCHEDACEVFIAVSKVIAAREARAVVEPAPRFSPADALRGGWVARAEDRLTFSRRERRIDERLAERPATKTAGEDARIAAFRLLILQTEIAKAPPIWNPDTPPLKVGPVLKANGKPKCIRRAVGRHEANACLVQYSGYSPKAAESLRCAARAHYAEWAGLLDEVAHMLMEAGDKLKRWRINGLGATREPWVEAGAVAA